MAAWNDQRLERIIGTVLITGVILSAAVVLLGGLCYLIRHGSEAPAYHVFHGSPPADRSVRGIVEAASPSNCQAVIQFGLLLLILTPITRVALSLAAFAMERDKTYVVLTAIVLAILVYSLAGEH